MLELDWQLPYDPDKITNQQLVDDWRLFVAAIANLDNGIDEPYTEPEIYVIAVACAKEIAKRVHAGNMIFTIAKDRDDAYEKFIAKIKNKLELWELVSLTESKQLKTNPQDEEALAPVNPSGVELGEEITLEELKKYFKSFYRTKPYISLIGGICNCGKTKGDIDFFINALQRDIATEFRIIRMFPKNYWPRFKFIYPDDEMHPGKFTNHLDIFNEKIDAISSPELVLMSAPKKVELFKFAKLLKPAHGRYKGEVYTVDNLIEIVNSKPEWYEKKIVINVKYDGIHCRADHSKEGRVVVWTEEGNKIESKLPTIVSELKKICKDHDVVIVGELESWKKGKHQARQLTTAIIHTKGIHEEEKSLKFNIFDCLYYK